MLQAAAMMLLAPATEAQTNACDQLKGVLSARINATGVRGYSLETVATDTAVPAGAKVIGNCEAGAKKILYRRWGAERPSPGGVAAAAAPASQPIAMPDERPRRLPGARSDRASPPTPASAPSPAPRAVPLASEAAASAASMPGREAERSVEAIAAEIEAARTNARMVVPTAQAPLDKKTVVEASWAQRASEFTARNWPWMWPLVLLLLGGVGVWFWRAQHSPYDKSGLPRGPKF